MTGECLSTIRGPVPHKGMHPQTWSTVQEVKHTISNGTVQGGPDGQVVILCPFFHKVQVDRDPHVPLRLFLPFHSG